MASEIEQYYKMGMKFHGEGKPDMAMNMWNECVKADPGLGFISAAYLNMFDYLYRTGRFAEAIQCGLNWMNFPLIPSTRHMVEKVDSQIKEMQQKLNPKPPDDKK